MGNYNLLTFFWALLVWLYNHPLVLIGLIVASLVFRGISHRADQFAAGKGEGFLVWILGKLMFVLENLWVLAIIWAVFFIPPFWAQFTSSQMNNAVTRWNQIPAFGTPVPNPFPPGISTPVSTQPPSSECIQIPTGNHLVTWDPTASLHSKPNGTSPIIAEIPKGQTVVVLQTSCTDNVKINGETRRVQVTWQDKTGWLHAATIEH